MIAISQLSPVWESGTSENKRWAPTRPAAAPENPPQPPWNSRGGRSFEGARALKVPARGIPNLETLCGIHVPVLF